MYAVTCDAVQVHAALQQVQQESGRLQASCDVAGADASAGAAETPGAARNGAEALAARPAHISWPRRRRVCGSDDGMGASATDGVGCGAADGNTGSSSGDRTDVDAGTVGADHVVKIGGPADKPANGCIAKDGVATVDAVGECADENPQKRRRVDADALESTLKVAHASESEGQTVVAMGGAAGEVMCGSLAEAAGAHATGDPDCASDSTLKLKAGDDADDAVPALNLAPKPKAAPMPNAVRERWEHVSPLAMQLFGGYRMSSRLGRVAHEGCAEAVGGAAAGASAGAADPHLHSAPWLRSVARDLQAVARFRWLPVVSSVQHAPSNTLDGNSGRRMVCAVALDRCEENLAVIGAILRAVSMGSWGVL